MFIEQHNHELRYMSDLKYLKSAGTRKIAQVCAAVCTTLALTSPLADAAFVGVNGTKLVVDGANPTTSDEVYMKGINLGNWLLWEGYLMVNEYTYLTHSQFYDNMKTHVFKGDADNAQLFEHYWRENYVTEQTIIELKNLGFNSIRVPFDYRMFYDDAADQLKSGNDPVTGVDPFHYLDNLVSWCEQHNIFILLDMHAAPGYQNPGDHSNNSDSDDTQPRDSVKFFDATQNLGNPTYPDDYGHIMKAKTVWKHIATHYKDTEIIWGYDLINEPVAQENREYEVLDALIQLRNSIREVDTNHVIVAEPNWWASEVDKLDWTAADVQANNGINTAWDSKLVYQIHHYVFGQGQQVAGPMSDRMAVTQNLNIPMILGEFGEDSEDIINALTDHAYMGEDINGNGIIDSTAEDCDYDGVIDPGEDVNQNGMLDPGEDANCDGVLQTPMAGDFYWSAKKVWGSTNVDPAKALFEVEVTAAWQDVIDCATTGSNQHCGNASSTARRDDAFAYAQNDIVQGSSSESWDPDNYYDDLQMNSTCSTASAISLATLPKKIEVDQEFCAKFNTALGGSPAYYVGWTDPGDWIDIKVNVPTAGKYDLDYRYATDGNSFADAMDVHIDNASVKDSSYPMAVDDQGTWEPSGGATGSTVVDLPAGDSVVRIYFNNGSINLDWIELDTHTAPPSPPPLASGVYKIKSIVNNKYLGCNDNTNGCNALTRRSGGAGDKILWQVTDLGSGQYKLENLHSSNRALNIDGWSQANGANAQLWTYGGGDNEKFLITKDADNANAHNIQNEHSDKYLDVETSGGNKDNVQQWDGVFGTNQEFEFIAQ